MISKKRELNVFATLNCYTEYAGMLSLLMSPAHPLLQDADTTGEPCTARPQGKTPVYRSPMLHLASWPRTGPTVCKRDSKYIHTFLHALPFLRLLWVLCGAPCRGMPPLFFKSTQQPPRRHETAAFCRDVDPRYTLPFFLAVFHRASTAPSDGDPGTGRDRAERGAEDDSGRGGAVSAVNEVPEARSSTPPVHASALLGGGAGATGGGEATAGHDTIEGGADGGSGRPGRVPAVGEGPGARAGILSSVASTTPGGVDTPDGGDGRREHDTAGKRAEDGSRRPGPVPAAHEKPEAHASTALPCASTAAPGGGGAGNSELSEWRAAMERRKRALPAVSEGPETDSSE